MGFEVFFEQQARTGKQLSSPDTHRAEKSVNQLEMWCTCSGEWLRPIYVGLGMLGSMTRLTVGCSVFWKMMFTPISVNETCKHDVTNADMATLLKELTDGSMSHIVFVCWGVCLSVACFFVT